MPKLRIFTFDLIDRSHLLWGVGSRTRYDGTRAQGPAIVAICKWQYVHMNVRSLEDHPGSIGFGCGASPIAIKALVSYSGFDGNETSRSARCREAPV
ncbi:hypothetical protein FOZ60_013524 [Perkinsus olseni]|uniref:Uncharacterized protein n=1 Tax=Perkinsus olseni TaxID=32597 RepID=A0A7J6PAM8_PEROL|nr:hypothetical protein FOZ60_013524 [Perkinsus olseni]